MKTKSLKLHTCPDCGAEFLSKYARKHHVCGAVGYVDISRIEALKQQRAAAARKGRMMEYVQ